MQLGLPIPFSEHDYQSFMYTICKEIYLFILNIAPAAEFIVTVTAPEIINGIIQLGRPHVYGAVGPLNYLPDGQNRNVLTPFLLDSKFQDIRLNEIHLSNALPHLQKD